MQGLGDVKNPEHSNFMEMIDNHIDTYLKKYIAGEYSVVDHENNNVNNDDLKKATGEQADEEDRAEILNDCKISSVT